MDKRTFQCVLAELQKIKVKNIRLYSTGEPLLHPLFDEFIHLAKQAGMIITVSTNGSLLSKHRDALLFVDYLQISISGWDKKSYEFLHYPLKYADVHQEVRDFFQSMQHMLDRPVVTIHLLLTRKTDDTLFRNSWQCFADEIKVTPHYLTGISRFDGTRFVNEHPEKLKEYFFPYTVDKSHGCMYPFDVVTIGYDGSFLLCCQDYSGDILAGHISDSVDSVFKHSKVLRDVRRSYSVCGECTMFHKVNL